MNSKKISKNRLLYYFSGVVFLLVAARSTSPLYPYYHGYDSAFFITMGRALISGRAMYLDYFDIKGPLLFLWEALGQCLAPGRYGAFVLECISIVVSLDIMNNIAKLFDLGKKARLILTACFYFVLFLFLFGGNTIEELTLPLQLLCIYHCLVFIRDKEVIGWKSWLAMGLVSGVFLFSKASLLVIPLACILTILIHLLGQKQYGLCLRGMLFCLLGLLGVSLPVILYYLVRGGLGNMVYWVFSLAFLRGFDDNYSRVMGLTRDLWWELYLLPCYLGAVYGIIRLRSRRRESLLLALLSVFAALILHLGTPYMYYLILTVPVIVLAFVQAAEDIAALKEKIPTVKLKAACASLLLVFLCIFAPRAIDTARNILATAVYAPGIDLHKEYQYFAGQIPDHERESIYCLNPGIRFFADSELLPANPCPFNDTYFGSVDKGVKDDILRELGEKKYAWLFMELEGAYNDPDYDEVIMDNYEPVANTENKILWHRKD